MKIRSLRPLSLILAAALFLTLGPACSLFNKAPLVPVVSGPTTNIVGVPVTFAATTTDPEGDSIAVSFDWGDGSTPAWTAFVASGESIVATHTYTDSGTFTVEAKAEDKAGKQSKWSVGSTISCLLDQAPLVPTASGPTTSYARLPVTFTTATTDPEGESIAVSFDWGDGSTPTWTAFVASGESIVATRAYADSGTFTIRAKAKDTGDRESQWSIGSTIVVAPAPDCPDSVTAVIDGGSEPVGIAVDPLGQYFYVAARGGNELRVYRTSDNVLESRIAVGGGPYCVRILPNGDKAYVPNVADATASVVRLSDRQVKATVPVGAGSCFCAALPNGEYVYVANKEAGSISVIRTSDDTVVSTFAVGQAPWNIVPTPDGQYLYISNSAGSTVTKVRVSDNTIVRTIPVNQCPEGMCLLPGGAYLYVACRTYSESYVDVVRTSDDVVVSRISVPGYVVEVVPLPGGEYVGYTTHESGEIGFISTATREVVWFTGSYGGCCYAAIVPNGNRMYVCALHEDHIVVVDRR